MGDFRKGVLRRIKGGSGEVGIDPEDEGGNVQRGEDVPSTKGKLRSPAEPGAGVPPSHKGGDPRDGWGGGTGSASAPPWRGGVPLTGGHQTPLLSSCSAPISPHPSLALCPQEGSRPVCPPPLRPPVPFIYRHHQHARAVTQRETPRPATPPPRPLAAAPRPALPLAGKRVAQRQHPPPSPLLTPIA